MVDRYTSLLIHRYNEIPNEKANEKRKDLGSQFEGTAHHGRESSRKLLAHPWAGAWCSSHLGRCVVVLTPGQVHGDGQLTSSLPLLYI